MFLKTGVFLLSVAIFMVLVSGGSASKKSGTTYKKSAKIIRFVPANKNAKSMRYTSTKGRRFGHIKSFASAVTNNGHEDAGHINLSVEDDEDDALNLSSNEKGEIFLEEEHEVDSDESFEDYDGEKDSFYINSGIKSIKTPSDSFFSVNIGKSGRSSIAVANSFSTGRNGRVKSEAIAYGPKN